MKKIEIIIGSPRKNGNTINLARNLTKYLDKSAYSISTIFISDFDINPCNDCRGCKNGDLCCIKNDGMNVIYDKLNSSDLIIIGSPIYWYGPTAYTKLMIDRLRPYFINKKLMGKKAIILLTAGDGEVDCDLTIEMFKRVFNTIGVEFIGYITAKAYNIGDLSEKSYSHTKMLELVKKSLISTI